MTRVNVWPDPKPIETATSYRYRPLAWRERAGSFALWLALLALVFAALSGCAPQPFVSCVADGCMSSIVEFEATR